MLSLFLILVCFRKKEIWSDLRVEVIKFLLIRSSKMHNSRINWVIVAVFTVIID